MNMVGKSPIDMVRIKYRIKRKYLEYMLRCYQIDPRVEYWRSYSAFNYFHNFVVPLGDSSVYIGIERLEDRKETKTNEGKCSVVLEFNPNETIFSDNILDDDLAKYFEEDSIYRYDFSNAGLVKWFFVYFIKNIDKVEFKYIHYCYDLEVDISQVISLRGRYNRKIFETRKGKTIYLGENYLKIYDKSAEAKLDKAITRIEVKIDLNCCYMDAEFEDVHTNTYVMKNKLEGVEGALLYAIEYGYDFNDLPKKWRRKIKDYMSESAEEVIIRGVDIQRDFYKFIEDLKGYLSVLNKSS